MAETQKTADAQAASTTMEENEFASLLNKQFKPQTDGAKKEVETAVRTLAQQALASSKLISNDVVQTINAMIAEIDRKMSEQINKIMHTPEFQQLEGAWRGLHYLVSNSETDDQLKIRVMNVSKKDLHKTLKRYKGAAWDQSPIFKKLYEDEYGTLGGEPFGCLVGDYYFDQGPMDVETSRRNGESRGRGARAVPVCGLAHRHPDGILAGTQQSPGPDQDIPDSRIRRAGGRSANPKIPATSGWRCPGFCRAAALRRQDQSGRGVLLRGRPGGRRSHRNTRWSNSAYAMAMNINRSFKYVRLVRAHSRHRIRRRGRRTCPVTPSRPTTAAWT